MFLKIWYTLFMDKIQKSFPYPEVDNLLSSLYFKDKTIGVLDIETTGLSSEKDIIILMGLGFLRGNNFVVNQYFAEEPSQEKDLLVRAMEDMSHCDYILTYNGRSFDWPFIVRRCEYYNIHVPLPSYHLDLYQLVQGYSPLKSMLPNLKQKTLESFMGLWNEREDQISGKESIDLYWEYVAHKNLEKKENILLHNSDDVVQLYRLLSVVKKADYHQAFTKWGFPVYMNNGYFRIEEIKIKKKVMIVKGFQSPSMVEYVNFEAEKISAQFSKGKFHINIPLLSTQNLILIDIEKNHLSVDTTSNGFLVIGHKDDLYYGRINRFITQYIERISQKWIINS